MNVNVMECFLPASVLIGKAHVVEIDAAVGDHLHRMLRVGQVGFLREYFHNTPSAGGAHGDHDEHHGQHHQGHEHAHDVAEHGGQLTGGQAAHHDKLGAEPGQGDHAAVNDQHHHRVI